MSRPGGRRVLALALPLLLAGCSGIQSALDPRGPQADAIATLAWVLFIGAALIFVAVMAMAVAGFIWPDQLSRVNPRRFMVGGGVVFTSSVLVVLTVYSTWVGSRVSDASDVNIIGAGTRIQPDEDRLVIEAVGYMWWWEFRYLGTPHGDVVLANEVHIPVGRPVEFRLKAADVIHSFWIPSLHGKRDMIPGHNNLIVMQAEKPGLLRGQCAEFCGDQHTLMSFFVMAHEPEEFEDWLAVQARPAREPDTPELQRGAEVFLEQGCGACHVVRGLSDGPLQAVGQLGPDLTHVGSRLSLGAGAMPNGVGPLGGWIANAQGIKPGNRMPNFDRLPSEDLTAVARYLESLK